MLCNISIKKYQGRVMALSKNFIVVCVVLLFFIILLFFALLFSSLHLFCLTCLSPLSSVATYNIKCNNHYKINVIVLLPYLKVEALQHNVKLCDIDDCAIRNTITFRTLSGK